MRVVTWNCKRASSTSPLWAYLEELGPDIALLQEVSGLPEALIDKYSVVRGVPTTKSGNSQRFASILLVRGSVTGAFTFQSQHSWVNRLLEHFSGNVMPVAVRLLDDLVVNVVLVYSPAWPVAPLSYDGEDVSEVKLKQNPSIWVTDLVTSALRSADLASGHWIVGGDFNSCETFDQWKGGPRGNKEWLDRMASIGLTECLRSSSNQLVPTFKGPRMAAATCQIDKLFVTAGLAQALQTSSTGDQLRVFGSKLSDHLPVMADFDLPQVQPNNSFKPNPLRGSA